MGMRYENRKVFTWGLTGVNYMYFLAQNIKMLFEIAHPLLHTNYSLYEHRSVHRSQIVKQNQIEGCLGHVAVPPHAHAHMHNAKKYMLRNCKWPTSWISCLMCVCACVHMHSPTYPHHQPLTHLQDPGCPNH